jgi:hypothetical protein
MKKDEKWERLTEVPERLEGKRRLALEFLLNEAGVSPFASVALALWERGYSIVPLEPGDKAIKLPGWQRYCKERANRATLEMWLDWPERNIGLALGPASGVIALDFDYDRDGKHAEIIKTIGDSPAKKRGVKGFTAFYRFSNQRSVKYGIGGDSVLEVLSTGRQTVLPPSIHPDTKQPYEWLTRQALLDLSPDQFCRKSRRRR